MKKQIVPCESTGREVSFEWSLHRILSSDSKVSVTLQNSIIHSGSKRVEPPLDQKILMWTKIMLWSPKKRTIMSVQIFLNLHLSFQRLRIIISFARLNYISFLLLFNSQMHIASQKKAQKNISYHSLIVTSAIPSPMSDNLNGRISPFIP